MTRKRKEQPIISGVKITDVAAEGNSLARIDDKVVFIPFGAPGDIATIKIIRSKRNYSEGRILSIEEASTVREIPRCSHFGICGGCKWQHLPYSLQLDLKWRQVKDALERIGKISLPEINPIIGSKDIWEYRNKLEYTYSNRMWIPYEELTSGNIPESRDCAGFHIPGSFDKVLDIDRCWLQDDVSNRLRRFIKDYGKEHSLSFYDLKAQSGFLRTLMVRTTSTGEIMALLMVGEDAPDKLMPLLQEVKSYFPEITSLQYVVNTKLNDSMEGLSPITFDGRDFVEERMESLTFRIGPKSFYQTNSRQAYELYKVVRRMADLQSDDLVYDLYTGTGTIANFVAGRCRRVVGVEYVEEAVKDARINSEANGIENTEFYSGDMKDVLTESFIAEHGHPDVMIIDPPRAGMHEDVVRTVLSARPRRIVYVSCNPATQARDLALMDELYEVVEVQPVDMFPHTAHVENVVRLNLRESALRQD